MNRIKRSVFIGILLSSLVALASYYQQNFFPIGFTGFEHTGYWGSDSLYKNPDGSPYPDSATYGSYEYGTWAKEIELLERTHCNFIGCADGYQAYYLNVNPALPDNQRKDYYNRVCLESDSIYLATKSTFCIRYKDWNNDGDINDTFYTGDTITDDNDELKRIVTASESPFPEKQSAVSYRWSSLWRNYWPQGRCGKGTADAFWNEMADSAALVYDRYFDRTGVSTSKFWGYNPFTEDPSMYVGGRSGIIDAGNRVADSIRARENMGSNGLFGSNRMIIAKGQLYPLMQYSGGEVNLFEKIPDIDAVLIYNHMIRGYMAYGFQSFFDKFLYGTNDPNSKSGYHNAAVYMQKYRKTPGGPSGQERRWMGCLQVDWEFLYDWTADEEVVLMRRPCPPEIRAMAYLVLSRGAKGLLFYSYLGGKDPRKYINGSDTVKISAVFPRSTSLSVVSNTSNPSSTGAHCLGLRDSTSRPCDSAYSAQVANIYLLDVPGSTTYWDGTKDTTFDYLCTLIPEIKLIAPTLMQLDWVNGYSLNSTDPEWTSPCPHAYVMDVSGVSYMDLGLFDHPYEPVGVEYFMLVNREGIADMTNRTVSVALDAGHWPGADSLTLTDIADKDYPQTLIRKGDRFIFTQVFEPGEGKLYRVSQINQAPIALSK